MLPCAFTRSFGGETKGEGRVYAGQGFAETSDYLFLSGDKYLK